MAILDIFATACCPSGGGGVGTFSVVGNAGPSQTVAAGDTLSILGAGLLLSTSSPADTVTLSLLPGANGQTLQTVAGVPTWVTLDAVGGPAFPGKAFTINGDLKVTGVIDPTKLIFSDGTPSSYDPSILNQFQIDSTIRDLMFLNNAGNIINLKSNRDLQAFNYPNTRNDGVPVNVLYTDAVGNVLSAPVTSLPGGGGGITSFNVAGDTGVQTITNGNTLSVIQGNAAISTIATFTDNLEISVVVDPSGTNPVIVGAGGVTFDYSKFDFSQVTNVTTLSPAVCEAVQDCVGGLVVPGSGLTYNDITNTLSVQISPNVGNIITLLPNGLFSAGGGGGFVSFDVAGSTGSAQTITNGNTIGLLAANASILTVGTAGDIVTFEVVTTPIATNPIFIDAGGVNFDYSKFDINLATPPVFNPAWCAAISVCGGGGGMTSFQVMGDTGTPQSVTNADLVLFSGLGLINTNAAAVDTIEISLAPGAANQILQTVAGIPTWVNPATVVTGNETPLVATDTSTIDFTTSGVSGHNLTGAVKISAAVGNSIVANVDGIFAPTGGGGGVTGANNGVSLSGSDVQLGVAGAGAGSPFTGNRSINLATFGLSFRSVMAGAPSGQASVLTVQPVYGQAISGNSYDFENVFPAADIEPGFLVGFAVFTNSGTMKRIDHDQMPYRNRKISINATLNPIDSYIEVDATAGARTITLPVGTDVFNATLPIDGQGKSYTIKKVAGANDVIIVVAGGGNIDGFSSFILTGINDAITLQASSTTRYSAMKDYIASGTNYVGGGFGVSKGNIRIVTANYTATLDDETILSRPGASELAITLPPHTGAYLPSSATTGNGKRIRVIHEPTGIGKTRVRPDPVFVFTNEADRLVAFGAILECQCFTNLGAPESAWILERFDYPTRASSNQGLNDGNTSPGAAESITWNRQQGEVIGLDFTPGQEPASIVVNLGLGGNPPGIGNPDYPSQSCQIHVGRVGACVITINFGVSAILGGAAGIKTIAPGNFKHVGLKGIIGGTFSQAWAVEGDLL